MYKVLFCALLFGVLQLFQAQNRGFNKKIQKKNASLVLDRLNDYAAKADFKNYFDLFADASTFIGTDAGEVWNKKEFMAYAKPHFDKGKAWTFKSLKRNIYFSRDGHYAWFDELLDTQMKICRGSGILEKTGNQWKIRQYVLSMTIPNEVTGDVMKIKAPQEDPLLLQLKKQMLHE